MPEVDKTPAKATSIAVENDIPTPEPKAPSADAPHRALDIESSAAPVAPEGSASFSSPTTKKSFAEAALAPVEARISADHLRQLTENAKLMEGGHDPKDGDKQWFAAALEVQSAEEAGVSCVACQTGGFLSIRFGSKVYRLDVVTTITELLIAAAVLLTMYLVLGSAMKPGGSVFGPLMTIIFGSLVGTLISTLLGLPPLVGMLIAGMIWGNAPGGLAKGISDGFYKFLRNCAVAVILARAGLTFKWALTKPVLSNVVLQSMLPQLCEVFAHATVAMILFPSYFPDYSFAVYQGAAIAASSTAVVIPGVSAMQERGFSVTRGPGILMLCSIAFDAVFAVWFTSFVFELVFPDEANNASFATKLALAPVQIIAGAIIGIVLGVVCYHIFNSFHDRVGRATEVHRESVEKKQRGKALILSTSLGITCIFASYKSGFPGAGTVAVVCIAGTLAYLWGRDHEQDKRRQLLYKDTARLWDSFVMPCLFSVVGSTIDLGILSDMTMLPSIVTCIGIGLMVKMVACMLVSSGAGYSVSEKLFLAFGWCAKSTVQAATAGKIALYVTELRNNGWADTPDKQAFLDQAAKAGALTNTVVVTSILFCAIGAGVSMKVFGPRFLVKEEGVVAGGH